MRIQKFHIETENYPNQVLILLSILRMRITHVLILMLILILFRVGINQWHHILYPID